VQADVLMWPPSSQRNTFNENPRSLRWHMVESSAIYDIDHIQKFAKSESHFPCMLVRVCYVDVLAIRFWPMRVSWCLIPPIMGTHNIMKFQ
jgi:hypothetical protein